MFGQDGLNKTNEFFHRLGSIWKKTHKYGLGVFCKNDAIYLIRLENLGERWELGENAMIPFHLEESEEADRMELTAERVASTLQVMGWPPAPIALCLSEQEIFQDTIHLPDMPADEMNGAIHWELDSRLDFEENDFLSAFLPNPETDAQWVAAIPKSVSDAWKNAWQNNDLELAVLTTMPGFLKAACLMNDDMTLQIGEIQLHATHELYDVFYENGGWEALYAAEALCLPHSQGLNFLQAGRSSNDDWNWRALSVTVIAAVSVGLLGCFLSDQFQLHAAQNAFAEQKNQLAILSNVQKEKELLESALSTIQKKNEHLVRLSKSAFPWHSIFVHLGTMTVDGVWLSDIALTNPHVLEIHGKAMHYGALAEFLQKFETDKDFFPQGPILKASDLEDGPSNQSTVCFQLQLELAPAPGDDLHAKAG